MYKRQILTSAKSENSRDDEFNAFVRLTRSLSNEVIRVVNLDRPPLTDHETHAALYIDCIKELASLSFESCRRCTSKLTVAIKLRSPEEIFCIAERIGDRMSSNSENVPRNRW